MFVVAVVVVVRVVATRRACIRIAFLWEAGMFRSTFYLYLNLSFLGRFYSLIYLNYFAKNLLYAET